MPSRLAATIVLSALAPAAALEDAFARDLCTRDDSALRALNRALARGPWVRARYGRYAPKP